MAMRITDGPDYLDLYKKKQIEAQKKAEEAQKRYREKLRDAQRKEEQLKNRLRR